MCFARITMYRFQAKGMQNHQFQSAGKEVTLFSILAKNRDHIPRITICRLGCINQHIVLLMARNVEACRCLEGWNMVYDNSWITGKRK